MIIINFIFRLKLVDLTLMTLYCEKSTGYLPNAYKSHWAWFPEDFDTK